MTNGDTEKRLWDIANNLRANSKLSSAEYSTPVLGLIFLRHADIKFTKKQKELEGKTIDVKHETVENPVDDS